MQYKIIALLVIALLIGGVFSGLLLKISSLKNDLLNSQIAVAECKSAIALQNAEIEKISIDKKKKELDYNKEIDNITARYKREREALKNGDKRECEEDIREYQRLFKQFFNSN